MKRIPRLDFLQPRPTPWLGWLAAGASLAALLVLALPLWKLMQSNDELMRQVQTASRARPASMQEASAGERRHQAHLRRVLAQLQAPWGDLFALLEQHADPRIGLLQVEPDAASGRVRLLAQGRDLPAMTTWLRRLEQDPRLAEVQIQQHQIEDEAPGRPVRFSVIAQWRGTNAATSEPPLTPVRTTAGTAVQTNGSANGTPARSTP